MWQEKEVVLKLSKSTKIIYALFHFFVPFLIFAVIVNNDELAVSEATRNSFSIPVLLLALFLLIKGMFSYRQFVKIDGNDLHVCVEKNGSVEILNSLNKNEIKEFDLSRKIYAITNEKKVALINVSPSMIPVALTLPFLSIPFISKIQISKKIMKAHLYAFIGRQDKIGDDTLEKCLKSQRKTDVFAWIVLIIIVFFGFVGLIDVLSTLL